MKRLISAFLSMLLTLCFVSPALAVDTDPDDVPNGKITIEAISLGDKVMEIPVLVTTEESTYSTYSGQDFTVINETCTYYVPVTDEGVEYNEAFIQSVKSARASDTSTDTCIDPKNYFKFKSTIKYTMYDRLDGTGSRHLVGMNNVAITTEEPVGLDWAILGIEMPTATIRQIGYTDRGDGIISGNGTYTDYQQVTQEIPLGKDGVDIDTDWYPIFTTEHYSSPYNCSVAYRTKIFYNDATEPLNFTHWLWK